MRFVKNTFVVFLTLLVFFAPAWAAELTQASTEDADLSLQEPKRRPRPAPIRPKEEKPPTPSAPSELSVAPAAPAQQPVQQLEPKKADPLPDLGVFPPAVKLEQVPTLPPQAEPAERAEAVSTPLRAAPVEAVKKSETEAADDGIYFNVNDEEIMAVIKQISRATGKNFILDSKIRGKITIISERKMTKDEIWEAFLSALEVAGYTIVQGPAGMIKVVAVRDALSSPIPIETETTPYTDQYITRLIPLKNISALDMSNAIKGLVSKTGNLFAYPATNTLIITDTGTNIERLLKLVKELDKAGPQEVLEIIPIEYASAADIAQKIQEIYPPDPQAQGKPRGRGAGQELEELPSVQKILSDDRTNSVILLASRIAIAKIRSLIHKLDMPLAEGEEGRVHVYYLKNADAEELAGTLQSLVTATASADKKEKGAAKATGAISLGEFEGEVKITADKNTNALVVIATQRDFKMLIERVVSKLDIPRSQVYVEAIIMELTTEAGLGIGTGALGGYALRGGDIALFGSSLGFLNPQNPLDPFTPMLGGGVGGANTETSIPVVLPTTGDNTQTVNVPAFFASFLAQSRNVEANILSTPNLLTLDNQKASIEVGQTIPFRGPTTVTSTGSPVTSFESKDVTLKLEITPQINESNTIQLEVVQKVEDILPPAQQAAIGQITAEAGPATSKRQVTTTVVANDAQTIVIGGLMEDKDRVIINKIPLLGDIPILGYFFKTKVKTRVKSNLLIFLTPHVIRQPRDFLAILQKKIDDRNKFISENYGRSQQKQIRKTIARHAEQLLEYKEDLLLPEVGPVHRGAGPSPGTPYWEDVGPSQPSAPTTPGSPPSEGPVSPAPPEGQELDLAF